MGNNNLKKSNNIFTIENTNLNFTKSDEDVLIEKTKSSLINLFNFSNIDFLYDNLFSQNLKNQIKKSNFRETVTKWQNNFGEIIYIKINNIEKINNIYKISLQVYHQSYITNFFIFWNQSYKIDFFSLESFSYNNLNFKTPDFKNVQSVRKEINYSNYNIKFIEYRKMNIDIQEQKKYPLILIINDITIDLEFREAKNFQNNLINFFVSRDFIVLTYVINFNNKNLINKFFSYETLLNLSSLFAQYILKNKNYIDENKLIILGFQCSNYYIPYIKTILSLSKNNKIELKGTIFLNPLFIDIKEVFKNYLTYYFNHDNYLTNFEKNFLDYFSNLTNEEIISNEFYYNNELWALLFKTNLLKEIIEYKNPFIIFFSEKNYFLNIEKEEFYKEFFDKIDTKNQYLINKYLFNNLNSFFSNANNERTIINNSLSIYPEPEFINILDKFIKLLK
ncbi:MAG: hypothetical protein N3A58_07395 [Spirochaetes bacterium]|nr:hypothetical protein [Spirochaetota bacterium]